LSTARTVSGHVTRMSGHSAAATSGGNDVVSASTKAVSLRSLRSLPAAVDGAASVPVVDVLDCGGGGWRLATAPTTKRPLGSSRAHSVFDTIFSFSSNSRLYFALRYFSGVLNRRFAQTLKPN